MTAPPMQEFKPRFPTRRKWPWRVLWGMVALLVGAVGFWNYHYWTALWERDALIAELRARGEPVSLQELVERLLAVERGETGARFLFQAADVSNQLDVDNGLYTTGFLHDVDRKFKEENPEPKIHPLVEKRIRGCDQVLALLEEAAKRPPGLVSTGYESEPPGSLIPRHSDVWSMRRLLDWVSYDALARGDLDRAYRALSLHLTLFEQTALDPFAHGQVNRIIHVHAACEQLKRCLPYGLPGESRFRQIDAQLSRWDDGFGVADALKAERAASLALFDDSQAFREHVLARLRYVPRETNGDWDFVDDWWFDALLSPVGRPSMLGAQVGYLRLVDRLERIVDRPGVSWSQGDALVKEFDRLGPFRRLDGRSNEFVTLPLLSLGRNAPNAHRQFVLARIALRLRRYRDEKGRFPATLEALCDQTMPTIRLDWFDGRPLVYKPREDGFLLKVDPNLPMEPGYWLKRNPSDAHTYLAWDFGLKPRPTKTAPQ